MAIQRCGWNGLISNALSYTKRNWRPKLYRSHSSLFTLHKARKSKVLSTKTLTSYFITHRNSVIRLGNSGRGLWVISATQRIQTLVPAFVHFSNFLKEWRDTNRRRKVCWYCSTPQSLLCVALKWRRHAMTELYGKIFRQRTRKGSSSVSVMTILHFYKYLLSLVWMSPYHVSNMSVIRGMSSHFHIIQCACPSHLTIFTIINLKNTWVILAG